MLTQFVLRQVSKSRCIREQPVAQIMESGREILYNNDS